MERVAPRVSEEPGLRCDEVWAREVSEDCKGPESIVLPGGEGTGRIHVFPGGETGDIDPVCQ